MSSGPAATPSAPSAPTPADASSLGIRKNGKIWKAPKTPQRIRSLGLSSTAWSSRTRDRDALRALKAEQTRLADARTDAIRTRVQRIKERQEAKAEQERYARLSETMHRKRLDRLKRREKRNKLLKDR
ncbi:uncharacterized protein V1518DRAFT_416887 [Limtongia smithiae]|uniref:uncharacterized protein n=1 Tax=Limtongia smithiae TaxID=1125753 RepID=UPI0034CF2B65